MKHKKSFQGKLRAFASYLWNEHKFAMIVVVVALGFLLASIVTYGQEIKTGQQVPDLTIDHVVNYKSSSLRLSDFKDRLLIIDFWATYCPPCRRLLPGYDSLQVELGDKVQFLLVTTEPTAPAEKFLKQSPYRLPSVTADNTLVKLFPHNSEPHEVWIMNGKVIATTFGAEVNRSQILAVLAGETPAMEQKNDNLSFDAGEPLLINGNGGTGQVLYQSLITPYIPGLNSESGMRHTEKGIVAIALNGSVIGLYHRAFIQIDPLLDVSNRYIVELPDTFQDRLGTETGDYHQWVKKYGFCYSLVLPPNFKGDIGRFMLADLNRFFSFYWGISARLEKRTVDCLVLSRIPGSASIASKGGELRFQSPEQGISLRNMPMHSFVMTLAYTWRRQPLPLVDETGYRGPVDLEISGSLSDRVQLDKGLRENGLQLTTEKRAIDMVIISDNNHLIH